jgi:hydroxyacylglutathione hydrolase
VLNTKEHATLDEALADGLTPLSLDELLSLVADGAQLLDGRTNVDFEGAHLRGAINVGLDGSYATWAGTLLDHEKPIVIVVDPGREQEAALRLGRIGFDNLAGYLDGGMLALDNRPDLVERTERITVATLEEQLAEPEPPLVLDVRAESERDEAVVEGSVNIPLGHLSERLDELPRDRALVVHCSGGYRSSAAASLLQREGFEQVSDLVGGLSRSIRVPSVQSPG